jgi:hypothetical protein
VLNVNQRVLRVIGYLFQARFSHYGFEPRAGAASSSGRKTRWSGGAAHPAGRGHDLVSVVPLLDRCAGRFADPDLNRDGALG